MSFFNTKEEVIDIELTPYGKHLLSKGKWKPVYYEFYDDDIIYDNEYAGITEGQEKIQERIKQTPRQKVQYSFNGADARYKEYLKQILGEQDDGTIDTGKRKTAIEANSETLEKRKNFSLTSLPLANSRMNSDKMPSWNISMLKGEIQNTSSSVSVTGLPNNLNILNLEDSHYKLIAKETDSLEGKFEIEVESDYLLLHIKEDNVDMLKENFDIFLYEIEEVKNEDGSVKEIIEKPLHFKNKKEEIVNGILIDPGQEQDDMESIDSTYASYYFSVDVDKEIDPSILSKHLSKKEKSMLSAVDGYIFEEDITSAINPITKLPYVSETDFEDC